DPVILRDIAQATKQRIAMTGYADIAGLSRQCRAWHVAESHVERILVRSLADDRPHLQLRNHKSADQSARLWRWRTGHRGRTHRRITRLAIKNPILPALEDGTAHRPPS